MPYLTGTDCKVLDKLTLRVHTGSKNVGGKYDLS